MKTLIPRGRYGKTTEKDLAQLAMLMASKEEFEKDEEFKNARIAKGFHFFNEDDPNRTTVESENIRRTFEFARNNNTFRE